MRAWQAEEMREVSAERELSETEARHVADAAALRALKVRGDLP